MQKTALPFAKTEVSISVAQLERYAQGWLLDSEIRQVSPATLSSRRLVVEKLLWFLRRKEYADCTPLEIRQFLAYISNGHQDPAGRWRNARLTSRARPSTTGMYYARLRTMFNFLVAEGILAASPMETIRPPVDRPDQIQPFTEEQVEALFTAAKRSHNARRDTAIVSFLPDTGVRTSELCALRMKDVDLSGRRCWVVGKGDKRRGLLRSRYYQDALAIPQ